MSNRTAQQMLQPIRRHAAFASSRPPFGAPDDYHRFANGGASDARHVSSPADDMVEALVVKTPVSSAALPLFSFFFFVLARIVDFELLKLAIA